MKTLSFIRFGLFGLIKWIKTNVSLSGLQLWSDDGQKTKQPPTYKDHHRTNGSRHVRRIASISITITHRGISTMLDQFETGYSLKSVM